MVVSLGAVFILYGDRVEEARQGESIEVVKRPSDSGVADRKRVRFGFGIFEIFIRLLRSERSANHRSSTEQTALHK